MTTRTKSELATAVMREMGSLDAMQTPAAEDTAWIARVYEEKHEMWLDRNLAYWPVDAIPLSIFLVVRDLIINEVRGSFGRPQSVVEKKENETVLLKDLRAHVGRKATGTAVMAEYM